MPTVLRLDRLRIVIYPNDHRPAHIHVIGAGGEAVFNLNCPDGPLELRESFRFDWPATGVIAEQLNEHVSILCQHWSTIHEPH